MHVYFDLDNTLVDDDGEVLRPGILDLLEQLAEGGVMLSLWTASTEERASEILERFDLGRFFSHSVFRDDYDPNLENFPKDIRYQNGDILVDDDPRHIKFVESIGLKGFLISPFLEEEPTDQTELFSLYQLIIDTAKVKLIKVIE